MKIANEIKDTGMYLTILNANYFDHYNIKLHFNNGKTVLIDFEPFLSNSYHPSIRKYLDKVLFKQFKLVNGNLNWNDYDLIFPIEDLYEGNLERKNKITQSSSINSNSSL